MVETMKFEWLIIKPKDNNTKNYRHNRPLLYFRCSCLKNPPQYCDRIYANRLLRRDVINIPFFAPPSKLWRLLNSTGTRLCAMLVLVWHRYKLWESTAIYGGGSVMLRANFTSKGSGSTVWNTLTFSKETWWTLTIPEKMGFISHSW